MDNHETNGRQEDLVLSKNRESRIEVVVNRPRDEGEAEIDLIRVFRNMGRRFRVFAWVILLCFAAGVCAPLLLYQLSGKPLTVSSVVTLRYDVVRRGSAGQVISRTPVDDLTAPDGETLDLSQVTASNVLQAALDGLELSEPVSLASLRNNIKIDRILTEDSRRQQEVASRMISDKNSGAYSEVQNIRLTYVNQFVVSLTNHFAGENSRRTYDLTDKELRLVLDRILTAYNDSLVAAYADMRFPDDEFAAIDLDMQDILESLDLLRMATQDLYDFCEDQPTAIKSYRSWRTGMSLNNLMEMLDTIRNVNVNYLYSYVSTNSIVRDRESMITNYRYQLRSAQNALDALNKNIETLQSILDNYKNDEIFVSMQESDTARATKTTTDYYNRLIMEQADNYGKVARLEIKIADLQYKLDSLSAAGNAGQGSSEYEKAAKELEGALAVCRRIYNQIREQFEEIHESTFFTEYAAHTVAQGRTDNFLRASAKKMVIGGAAGVIVACGLWFLSALAMEFRSGKDSSLRRKEAADDEA